MKNKYTQQDLDQFFQSFKALPEYYELEKVHQFIDNADVKARHSGKTNFKPLKLIIMITSIITVLTVFLLWLTPITNNSKEIISDHTNNPDSSPEISTVPQQKDTSNSPIKNNTNESKTVTENVSEEPNKMKEEKPDKKSEKLSLAIHEQKQKEGKPQKPEVESQQLKAPADSSHTWPKDTVIDGNNFLVTLSDSELEKLGFMLDETGIYYKNIYLKDTANFHSRFENHMGEITNVGTVNSHNKKTAYSHLNYYPVMLTDLYYKRSGLSDQDFQIANDTLLPIVLKSTQLKFDQDDRIIWFKVSDHLFAALPVKWKHLQNNFSQIESLKKQYGGRDIVKYEAEDIIDKISFIELSKEELQDIGFKIQEFSMNYEQSNESCAIRLEFGDGGHGVRFLPTTDSVQNSFQVVFLSDTEGYQSIKWKCGGEDKNKHKTSYFRERTQLLIPIILRQKKYPQILTTDQVFWFEPSEALFEALPEEIGSQLSQEYQYLTAPNEEAKKQFQTTCTYFEACKSTLPLDDLKLYPNPATNTSTIEFNLPQDLTGSISLVNIAGVRVKILVKETILPAGFNTYSLDVSNVSPGMYVISINTNKGFKTQRLMITR